MVTTDRIMRDEPRLQADATLAEERAQPAPPQPDRRPPPPPAVQRPRRSRRVWRFVITALILVVVLGGLYAFNQFRQSMIAQYFASNVPPPTPVAGVTATVEDVPQYLQGIGSLKAVHQVTVAPQVDGRVEAILFEAGATVSEGQPLVQLDDDAEQAEVQVYQAQAKLAELNLGRAQELYERRTGPKTTVDENRAQLDQARANMERMQALIGYKVIVAPFSGQLGVRQVDFGQYVSPGSPIATLTDLSRLFVDFTLAESVRSQIVVGQAVTIAVDAFPGRDFAAKVTAIEPQVSTDTRTILVQATMDNPGNVLLPGMFANARVQLPPLKDVVTVPQTAVDYTLYGDSVFLIKESGKDDKGAPVLTVTRAFVETGQRFGNTVAILKGLKAGDMVVASGQLKLNNGAKVTLTDPGTLTPPETPPTY